MAYGCGGVTGWKPYARRRGRPLFIEWTRFEFLAATQAKLDQQSRLRCPGFVPRQGRPDLPTIGPKAGWTNGGQPFAKPAPNRNLSASFQDSSAVDVRRSPQIPAPATCKQALTCLLLKSERALPAEPLRRLPIRFLSKDKPKQQKHPRHTNSISFSLPSSFGNQFFYDRRA